MLNAFTFAAVKLVSLMQVLLKQNKIVPIKAKTLKTLKAYNIKDCSDVFESLFTGSEKEAYADSAYQSKAHNKHLKEKGVRNRVLERTYRNKPLTEAQKHLNRMNSKVRCTVERVFGVFKLQYGMAKTRHFGQTRNRARFGLLLLRPLHEALRIYLCRLKPSLYLNKRLKN
ncbi:MAG: hypothetical protein COB77_06580 [Gammaproteobacteria bacterium]|nr:MAG: hypothetical protein COB77_06580 [Gammaproteobacteria bacterium]